MSDSNGREAEDAPQPSLIVELLKRALAIVAVVVVLIPPLPLQSPVPATTDDEAGFRFGKGSLTLEHEWIVLRLAGDPYEMGYQQGVLLGPYIRWLLAETIYPSLLDSNVGTESLPQSAYTSAMALPAEVRQEMQGVADGAGITLADVILLNVWPDLLLWPALEARETTLPSTWRANSVLRGDPRLPLLHGIRPHRGLPQQAPTPWTTYNRAASRPGGGVLFAAWGEATASSKLWLAGQLDGYPQGPYPLVVERRPSRGAPILGVALPGWVGLVAGMNDNAVAALVTRSPSIDSTRTGVPAYILVRLALQRADTADELVTELVERPRMGGSQVLVSDQGDGGAIGVELSARQFRIRSDDTPWLLLSALPRHSHMQTLAEPAASPPWHRYDAIVMERVAPWLRLNAGFIGRESVERLLIDLGARDSSGWVTVIAAPSSRQLWLAQPADTGPAPAAGFVAFDAPISTALTPPLDDGQSSASYLAR